MLSARPASRPPTKRQANASKDYDFLDEEPPLAIPAWSLSGAGSSSKVLSTLGAPVTLNGTNGAATARMESPLGKRSPNERRPSTGHGLLATLRKPSLAFSSPSNRSASPDKPTSPHAGSERGRMRSPSKTKPPPLQPVSLGRKHSASDDELDVDDEEPSIFGSPDTVKIDMPKVKTTPTSAPAHLKSFPTSPIEEMPKADMRADPLRSSSRLSPILDQRDRALSVSSVPRGSPIPSAFDGSLINSPSFVNGSGDPSMAGPQAVDGQIEEIVPWLFQGQQNASTVELSPRSRQTSFHSSKPKDQNLRNAKSSSALRTSQSEAQLSSPDRKASKGKGLFGMLRRKASSGEGLRASTSESVDGEPAFSNPFADAKSSPSRVPPLPSSSDKRGKKPTKSHRAPAPPRSVAKAGGIELDTNLDHMEGIIATTTGIEGEQFEGALPIDQGRRPSLKPTGLGLAEGSDGSPGSLQPASRPSSADRMSKNAAQNGLWSNNAASFSLSSLGNRGPAERRGSAIVLPPTSAAAAAANGVATAGWTAPDSWAVHDEANQDKQDDGEESDEAEGGASPGKNGSGHTTNPNTPLLASGALMGPEGVRPSSAGHRGGPSQFGRRPGTANSMMAPTSINTTKVAVQVDGTHAKFNCSINATVADIAHMAARKPGFAPSKGTYRLFARERGLERSMAPSEKPVLLQKRRLEQAGYNEEDKIEDVGREDHSYLIKYIYKTEAGRTFGSQQDDDQLDGYEFVNLDARGLQTIPIYLYRRAHELVCLQLSKNPKLELPSDFIQACVALREVKMTDMGIKRIPASVRQATGLTRLDVSNNRIVELDHISLDDLSELNHLKASNNRLFALPEYFGRFQALKYLIVSNNKFETFPLAVCEIASLIDLDISFNMMTSLPDDISKLVNLERLVIFGNAVTSLPSTFGSLVALRELDARRNAITSFAVLEELPKLEWARLQHNAAPAFEGRYRSMRRLEASHNPLTKINLLDMASTLVSLNLSNAKLSVLPPELFAVALTALEVLVVDGNQLRNLPEGIGSCTRLERLSVRANHIDIVPATVGKLQRLQSLDVSNNNVHTLPAEIWLCGELVMLNASSNLLTEFPDPPQVAVEEGGADEAERKASVASKSSGQRVAAAAASSLLRLYLADNRLPDETFHPISLMTELRILNLSFNELYEIPSRILAKSAQLEELYLSGNMLTTLPEDDMARLQNLRTLHLNGNKLQTLPAELGQLKKLQYLDVGNNVLKYNIANWKFDWNWNWNQELKYLNLSGNKRLEIKPAGPQNLHTIEDSPATSKKRRNLSDFAAMKKLRVLGLMDVTLTITSVPEDSEDRRVRTSLSEVNGMGYGIADTLGRNGELAMVDMVVRRFRGRDDECIFGIFDGRPRGRGMVNTSTSRIAKYLQDCFTASLSVEISRTARARQLLVASGTDIEDLPSAAEDASESLRRTFLNLNRDYGNILLPLFDGRRKESDAAPGNERFQLGVGSSSDVRNGASAVVVYITGRTLHVANAGDALAVMANRGGGVQLLSVKHDPQAPEEVARVRAAEGFVSLKGFVNDELDVSRSFGYFHVFPAVSACPVVQTIELSENDEFVIIANRGLWDVMSYQSAVDTARTVREDPMAAAQKLRDLAIGYGSDSNIMVMVVSVGDLFKAKQAPVQRGASVDAGEVDVAYGGRGTRRGYGVAPGERYLTLLDREVPPPIGNVALVFTDIRNSTALWETNPGMQIAMRMHNQLLRRQLRSIGGYEVKTEGDAFMCSFPSVTSALLWCFTVQMELTREDWPQALLDSEDGREIVGPHGDLLYRGLSVRMGIHWGQPVCEADPITRRMDYFGPVVNRASRISGVADGGQISASADALDLVKSLCGLDAEDVEDTMDVNAFDRRLAEDADLDAAVKRDVLAIRKLGVGITELGERRLKGLETPENLFLLYPTALAGRLKHTLEAGPAPTSMLDDLALNGIAHATNGSTTGVARTAEMYEPLPHALDAYQVTHLYNVCLRLELAVSALLNPAPPPQFTPSASPMANRQGSLGQRKRIHPWLISPPIRIDASDDELAAIIENIVGRIENVLSTLTLHHLGPYTDVLSALSSGTGIDSRQLLQALTMFASVMGQTQ